MHPFRIANEIDMNGYTYTYWMLRTEWGMRRTRALWLLWVARQHNRHCANRNLLDDLID